MPYDKYLTKLNVGDYVEFELEEKTFEGEIMNIRFYGANGQGALLYVRRLDGVQNSDSPDGYYSFYPHELTKKMEN